MKVSEIVPLIIALIALLLFLLLYVGVKNQGSSSLSTVSDLLGGFGGG